MTHNPARWLLTTMAAARINEDMDLHEVRAVLDDIIADMQAYLAMLSDDDIDAIMFDILHTLEAGNDV
jgi:5-bromo-4-chloroindolyl phosphate hydrolysis protein